MKTRKVSSKNSYVDRLRVAFITDEAWDKIGLPRGEMKDGQSEAVSTNS